MFFAVGSATLHGPIATSFEVLSLMLNHIAKIMLFYSKYLKILGSENWLPKLHIALLSVLFRLSHL